MKRKERRLKKKKCLLVCEAGANRPNNIQNPVYRFMA